VTCHSIRTKLPDVRTEFFVENVKGTPRPIVTARIVSVLEAIGDIQRVYSWICNEYSTTCRE